MDALAESLARSLIASADEASQQSPSNRFIVLLSGIPGSGKSTLASRVEAHVNRLAGTVCKSLSMDGFHLARSELDRMPNREEAYRRRGAPWTFDADALIASLEKLRPLPRPDTTPIAYPTFSHAKKDPVSDGVLVLPTDRILIIEGLYLLLRDVDPWRRLPEFADQYWWIECDVEVAVERVARRHVESGIEPTIEQGRARANDNDLANATFVMLHRMQDSDIHVLKPAFDESL
ncbi:P-loop containing nucleoside triphosphate hydrolase protein [Gonapodya prolifera JEL478]|uniref:p-loop containing nucleoside triphosphate hydrolase protein n=1 Tax=Gonapodya prolifera (strain JEL478) TaxID=1344416 RepID=A0A138ZYA7_GONPJ|nr:P-loop containing nucleoside triphosphate hydrolase protein [Gonapodya prolifera JEL478]|eukprot:KXS09488.1 P-loop containing nucleoside triphosphate hydrolase protein [Gonapodya prolifera JEL478]